MYRLSQQDGFSLIELTIILVVIGIVLAVAMQSMTVAVQDIRTTKTEREMASLSKAILGDPTIMQNGIRADFGYVGDNGAFPPSLDYLASNVGGTSTWNGPYLPSGFTEDATGYKTDEWGAPYSYTGTAISSTGSGSAITQSLTNNPTEYLRNSFLGSIADARHNIPGIDFADSIRIVVTYPNGAGSFATKSYTPDLLGAFRLDSLPVGQHTLNIVYSPAADTLHRQITVLPRMSTSQLNQFYFGEVYFASGSSGTTIDTLALRPMAAGSETNLLDENCSGNWKCVDEVSSDGDGTFVKGEGNSYKTDLYTTDDPGVSSGTINSVTIFINCEGGGPDRFRTAIRTNSQTFEGATENPSGGYELFSTTYTVNPATGSAWTWQEIVDIEIGVVIRKEGFCTQVWIDVEYEQ